MPRVNASWAARFMGRAAHLQAWQAHARKDDRAIVQNLPRGPAEVAPRRWALRSAARSPCPSPRWRRRRASTAISASARGARDRARPGRPRSPSTWPRARLLFAQNADTPLQPASNEKLCVSYTALVELGPELPLPHRGARRGPPGRQRLARAARAQGLRRPDALGEGHRPPRRPDRGARHPPRHGPRRRRRLLVRPPLDRDRLAAGVRDLGVAAALGARRRPRLAQGPPGPRAGARRRGPVRPACSARAGSRRATRRLGRARPGAIRLAKADSARLSHLLKAVDTDSDNYSAELVLKAIGREVLGKGSSAAGAHASCGATSPPRACRSPASASSTARASRARTASPPASSARSCSRSGTTRSCGRSCATRSRWPGMTGTLAHRLGYRPRSGACARRPARPTSPRRSRATSARATRSSSSRTARPSRLVGPRGAGPLRPGAGRARGEWVELGAFLRREGSR